MQLSIVRALLVSLICCVCATSEVSAQGQSDDALWQQIKGLGWKTAPQIGRLGAEASITLSSNVGFLGSADTSRFLELNGNPPSRLLKKVLKGCRYATLIQIRARWRTKDSIERPF